MKDNQAAGWVTHSFDSIRADAVRLTITRSSHPDRMGVGEVEIRFLPAE